MHVHEGASSYSNKITALAYGTMVMIVERCGNGWLLIQYDEKGNYGYVSAAYVTEYDLDYYCTVSAGGNSLNLRTGRGTGYGVITSIPAGRGFPELTYSSSWDYVLYGNKDGYVSTSYIKRTHY